VVGGTVPGDLDDAVLRFAVLVLAEDRHRHLASQLPR
jgi:hypothetical protein